MRLFILISPKWLKDFAGGWIFYTTLPKIPKINPSFNRIARFAPLIGILLGVIQSSIWLLLEKAGFSKEILPFFIVSTNIFITGGLHLDGLIDTADGFAASKEKRFKAMKDSRIGSIGLLSLVSILFIQLASLNKLNTFAPIAIIISSFWGRFSTILAINYFPYLHREINPSFHHKHWKGFIKESKVSFIILSFMIFAIYIFPMKMVFSIKIIVASLSGIIPSIYIPNLLANYFEGHSGDTYGACVVLVETFMLFALALILY